MLHYAGACARRVGGEDLKYLGWVDSEGDFHPRSKPGPTTHEWKETRGYIEQHEDGRVLFWTFTKLIPISYPDLDTALVAIKLRLS